MHNKKIKWGAILSYTSIAVNIVAGVLYTPWIVETIGESQYGLYTLANSLITLFLVDFGLSSATGRYLSKYNAKGDREGAERFLGAIYKLYLVIDAVIIVILVAVFFLLDSIFVNLTPTELEQFKVVYIISALFSIVNFPFVTFNGILTAYEKFVPLKIADLLYRFLNIGLTAIVLLLGYGLYALVTVHAVAGLLTLVFKFVIIRRSVPINVSFRSQKKEIYKDIFGFSIWVTISSLALRLVFNITPSILGAVASSTAIAVFGVISTLEGYVYTITTAINGMFMPRIAKIMTNERAENDLNRLLIGVGRFQFALNGLIISGFAIVGQSFIQLWMGEDYASAYLGILLVLIPGLFYNSMQIANTTMVIENKVKKTAIVCVVTGVVNVVLSFPLSSFLGVTGACVSICIAYFVRNLLSYVIYHKELPLDILAFMKACYGRMSVPIILTLLCGMLINSVILDSGWMIFLVKGVLVVAVYLAFVCLFGLKKEERGIFAARVKKKLSKES